MGYSKINPDGRNEKQVKQEYIKINLFLNKAAPLVLNLLEDIFRDHNIDFTRAGQGLNMKYDLKKGQLSSTMFLGNLFLEIATVDRDSEPLIYDKRLNDFKFFIARLKDVINSKIAVLIPLMEGKDIEEAKKIAKKRHSSYERFIIKELDPENMSEEMKRNIEKGFMP